MIYNKDIERLLNDSDEVTFKEVDELAFIKITLRLLLRGFTYEEALQMAYSQLSDSINGE